jgi:hypothetical protein
MRSKRLSLLLSLIALNTLLASPPQWWITRGVVNPAKPANDFALVNQGQLKNLARGTAEEMDAKLPGGAGATITLLVASWAQAPSIDDFYLMVNVAQLQTLADLFYDRIEEVRAQVVPTWSAVAPAWATQGVPGPSLDMEALVNIGQVKHAFAQLEGDRSSRWRFGTQGSDPAAEGYQFGLGWFIDSDGDGVPDYLDSEIELFETPSPPSPTPSGSEANLTLFTKLHP